MLRFLPILFCAVFPCLAGSLTGKVTDSGGQGLANITITVLEADSLCSLPSAISQGNGDYQLDNIPDGPYIIHFFGQGILPRYVGNTIHQDIGSATVVQVNGTTTQNITAVSGGTITGQVTVNGGSVNDASVQVVDPITLFPLFSLSATSEIDGNGNYTLSGLESGCYLVVLIYDPDTTGTSAPVQYYNGAGTPEAATLVDVTAGQTTANIDFNFTVGAQGTLEVTLNGATSDANPQLTAFDSRGNFYSADLNPNGVTSVGLPPGTYQLGVSFDNTFLDIIDADQYGIQAGQTTAVSYNATLGGAIEGTVTYDFLTSPFNGFVEAVDASSRIVMDAFPIVTVAGGTTVDYSLSGLPGGDYLVRIIPADDLGIGAFFSASVRLEYYNDATNADQAQAVSVSAGQTVGGIDIALNQGGSIQGTIQINGQPLNALIAFVAAVETSSQEVFYGLYSNFLGAYVIQNLPPGTYKVGLNAGLVNQSRFTFTFLSLFTFPLLGCGAVGPSFYDGATNLENATNVSVGAGQAVTGININASLGGGITGQVVSQDCACPLQSGLIGAFQGGELRRLGVITGGDFEIGGLAPGQYQLRVSDFFAEVTFDLAGQEVDLDAFSLEDIFSDANSVTFNQTVTVQASQYTSIGEWCAPLQVVGGQGGGGTDEETQLVYAWISNREGDFESILVANNYGDRNVEVTLQAFRNAQENETVTRVIPARGFLEEQASSLFPTLGSGPGYTVVLSGPSEKIRGSWVTNNLQAASGESPSQGVAVRIPQAGGTNERVGREIIFGYLPLSNNMISAPVVTNIGDAPTDITLRFFDSQGAEVGNTVLEDVAPFLPFAQVANNLVPAGTGDVYLTAESSGALITGVSFVFNQAFGETAIGNVTGISSEGADEGATTLVYPWVSNNAGSFESIVVANNYGDLPVEVTLTARRNTNPVASQTVNRVIPAQGFLNELASSLFDELGSGPGYAVELTSPSSKVNGQWVTNNLAAASGQSPSQGVAIKVPGAGTQTERVGTDLLFGFLPVTGSFTSAPVVVNVGQGNADVTLRFYDQNGNLVVTDDTTLTGLAPNVPFASLANALLPGGSDNVYLVASSSGEPITGVVFVFNGAFNEPAIGNATAIDFEP